MKKKILITGVCGFIGYSLAEKLLLKKNFIVVGIDSINNYYEPRLKKDRLKNLIADQEPEEEPSPVTDDILEPDTDELDRADDKVSASERVLIDSIAKKKF